MSVSSRDRSAIVYPYAGANAGGFATATYGAARGTFFCRVSAIPGEEAMLDGQAAQTARAILEFADEVPITENDLVVVDGVQWQAGPITLRRAQRAKLCRVSRSLEAPVYVTG